MAKRTRWRGWGQKCPGVKFRPSQNTGFQLGFFDETGPIPLFRAYWLYGAFGGKILPYENLLNFASKTPSNLFFQKTRFRFEFLNEIAPHLFSWLNGLDGTIGGKSVPE